MSLPYEFEAGCEPERYELDEVPSYRFQLGRRDFCKVLGGGIVVLLLLDRGMGQEPGRGRRRGGGRGVPAEIGAWLHIAEDGSISVYTGKVEVGQNIRTSLAQVVADELSVPLDSIRLVMADTQLTPFDAGTFGSRTTPDMAARLRRVAAATRELLIDLAAKTWNIHRASLAAAAGKVIHPDSDRAIEFGKLALGQKITQTVSENTPVLPPERWRIAGHSVAKVDGRAFVTGRHRYASDIILPGMLHGKVLRPSSLGATLVSLNSEAVEAFGDVLLVRDGDFVGVAAPSEFQAARALAAVKAEWRAGPQVSGQDLFAYLKQQQVRPAQGGEADQAENSDRSRRVWRRPISGSNILTPRPTLRMPRWNPAPPSRSGTKTSLPSGPGRSDRLECGANWPAHWEYRKTMCG
jgi:isoquinoline 1-oxidoreductase